MEREPYGRLREARIRAGFASPAEAASRFVWNPNTYKSHENGFRGIGIKAAERYGKAFHVSAGWILTGEGSPPPLDPDESALLARHRALDEGSRRILRENADSLLRAMQGRIPIMAQERRKRRS